MRHIHDYNVHSTALYYSDINENILHAYLVAFSKHTVCKKKYTKKAVKDL